MIQTVIPKIRGPHTAPRRTLGKSSTRTHVAILLRQCPPGYQHLTPTAPHTGTPRTPTYIIPVTYHNCCAPPIAVAGAGAAGGGGGTWPHALWRCHHSSGSGGGVRAARGRRCSRLGQQRGRRRTAPAARRASVRILQQGHNETKRWRRISGCTV